MLQFSFVPSLLRVHGNFRVGFARDPWTLRGYVRVIPSRQALCFISFSNTNAFFFIPFKMFVSANNAAGIEQVQRRML